MFFCSNSMQHLFYCPDETTWEEISPKGHIPSPRTCLNVATIGNKLYIFGGGFQGANPVTDTKMHVFDAGLDLNVRILLNLILVKFTT